MIRQPPDDSDRAAPDSPDRDPAAPGGATGTGPAAGTGPGGEAEGEEEPTRRLPAVPERFAPGRARITEPAPAPGRVSEPVWANPPAAGPVRETPMTAPYPPAYLEPYRDEEYAYQVIVVPTNGMAVWALICSVIGIFTCFTLSPLGALLGHLARRRIRRTGEAGDGMALAGIVIGWIGMALFAVCCGGALVLADSIGLGDLGASP
jgi:Domain of unknown function (DUF4190)